MGKNLRPCINTTKHEVPIRRPKFNFSESLNSRKPKDLVISNFLNSLSIALPIGEAMFIESIKNFENKITNKYLLNNVKQFYGQESSHTFEHKVYNEMLKKHGYDVEKLIRTRVSIEERSKRLVKQFGFIRRRMLAVTLASEYCISLLANQLLITREVLDGIEINYANLWLWHAVEEIEHKSVAYDVYLSVGGCYSERVAVLIAVTVIYAFMTIRNYLCFLKKDKLLLNLKAWAFLLKVSFFKPGFFRQVIPKYFKFFRMDFHPWDENNLYLIEKWKSEYPDIDKTKDKPVTYTQVV